MAEAVVSVGGRGAAASRSLCGGEPPETPREASGAGGTPCLSMVMTVLESDLAASPPAPQKYLCPLTQ